MAFSGQGSPPQPAPEEVRGKKNPDAMGWYNLDTGVLGHLHQKKDVLSGFPIAIATLPQNQREILGGRSSAVSQIIPPDPVLQ